MATNRELPCNQCTGTTTLQKLEGFASRLFHRHARGTAHDQKSALENDSLHFSEHTALWDRSSKFSLIYFNYKLKYIVGVLKVNIKSNIFVCLSMICIRALQDEVEKRLHENFTISLVKLEIILFHLI